MARSGSFGGNPNVDPGVSPAIPLFGAGILFSDPRGLWLSIYAASAVHQYYFVTITPHVTNIQSAAEQTTTTAGSSTLMVGVAQVAIGALSIGLVWIGGPNGGGFGSGIKGTVAASFAALAQLNTTATPGIADDASTTVIKGGIGLTLDSGSGSAIELYSTQVLQVN